MEAATTLWNCVICVPWEEYQQLSLPLSFSSFPRLYLTSAGHTTSVQNGLATSQTIM